MKTMRWLVFLVVFLGVADARGADDHPLLKHPEVDAVLRVLEAWIDTTVQQREQPGLSIGIVYDQDLIWHKGFGYADVHKRTPATEKTLYRIASISKLFTATAVMQLRDAGKLRLDDPVSKHLSWFRIKSPYRDAPPISILHLLTHTSGLPREAKGLNWSDLVYPSRDEMVAGLPEQEVVFPPETEWKYSNLALSLAGEIVNEVSGDSWADYVSKNILQPLGMTSTQALPQPSTPGLAVGYGRKVPGREREIEPFVDIQAERPAGNLASNVEDLAKFMALQFRDGPAGGKQILKGVSLREMHRVHWLRPDWTSGWGVGFAVRRVDGQVRVGHGGSLPGHRTQIELAPQEKIGVIVLTNANDGNPGLYLDKAFAIVGPAIARATEKTRPPAIPDPAWEQYVGTYSWKHSEVRVFVLNGELTLVVPESENPWETRVRLEPVGPHTFRAVSVQWSYSWNGDLIRFEVDATGKAVRVGTENFYWVRK